MIERNIIFDTKFLFTDCKQPFIYVTIIVPMIGSKFAGFLGLKELSVGIFFQADTRIVVSCGPTSADGRLYTTSSTARPTKRPGTKMVNSGKGELASGNWQ